MEKGCGHHRHVGPCPSCQRAKIAERHEQEDHCRQLAKDGKR